MPFPFTFACWRPNLWVISKIASWENCCHALPSRAIRIVNGRAREIIASLKGIFQPAIYKPMREVRGKDKLSSLRKCFFAPKERHAKRFIAGQRDFRFMTCWRKAGEGWTKKKVVSKEFRETSSDESNYRGMRSRARAVFTLRERRENWAKQKKIVTTRIDGLDDCCCRVFPFSPENICLCLRLSFIGKNFFIKV